VSGGDSGHQLANGRMSASSYRNYRLIKLGVGRMLRRLARICAQDEGYAKNSRLGRAAGEGPGDGTMKFDTAQVAERVEGDRELAGRWGYGRGQSRSGCAARRGRGKRRLCCASIANFWRRTRD